MRWFKHLTRAHVDENMTPVLSEAGPEAYGFYWLLCEVIAERIGGGDVTSEAVHPLSFWRANLYTNRQKLLRLLELLAKFRLVSYELCGESLKVSIPKLLKYRDEYTLRVGRVSGECPESVRSKELDTDTDTDTEPPIVPQGDGAGVSQKPGKSNASKPVPSRGNAAADEALLFDRSEDAEPSPADGAAYLTSVGWQGIRKTPTAVIDKIYDLKGRDIPEDKAPDSLYWIYARLGWFEEFWMGYWRKACKKEARVAYFERVTTLALHEQIVAAVEAQSPVMLTRSEEKRPHGATWIRAERWDDTTEAMVGREDDD